MSWTVLAAAAILAAHPLSAPPPEGRDPPAALADPGAPTSTQISVLTYNVRGLPWPIARGRGEALRAIGRELAHARRLGRQPDVVLIQEGFRGEAAELVRISGYRHWAIGPGRFERPPSGAHGSSDWRAVRYPLKGEGWGKFVGSGLLVLSDLPITRVQTAAYRHCAGLDCLANKGVMLVRLSLPGEGGEIDVINTHLNSRRKARVPVARALRAHNLQMDEFLGFLTRQQVGERPLLIGGDFNVRNAPERYGYRAGDRAYKVVAEYCSDAAMACEGAVSPAAAQPWLQSQDLAAFHDGRHAQVRPVRIEPLFSGPRDGGLLSDHKGYLVRYRVGWSRPAPSDVRVAEAPADLRAEPAILALQDR
jgi:endonuclease/exonuclease/phosphatase family metal-dependent hydrolase